MKIATGEYLTFLDGDDWFTEEAFEISYNEAKAKDTDITMYQMINYDDETGRVYENDWFNLNNLDESFDNVVFSPEKTKDFLFDLSVSSCQKIYRNTFLKSIDASFPEGPPPIPSHTTTNNPFFVVQYPQESWLSARPPIEESMTPT